MYTYRIASADSMRPEITSEGRLSVQIFVLFPGQLGFEHTVLDHVYPVISLESGIETEYGAH